MKTSNKLLLFGLLLLFLAMITFLIAAKNAIILTSDELTEQGIGSASIDINTSDVETIEKSFGTFSGNLMKLSHHHNYTLDPSSSEIIISGSSEVINKLILSEDQNVFEIPKYVKREETSNNLHTENYDYIKETLNVKIGLKDKRMLHIVADKSCVISTLDTMRLDKLKLSLSGRTLYNGNLICDVLDADLSSEAFLEMKGHCNTMKVKARNYAVLNSSQYKVTTLDVTLENFSSINLYETKNIEGHITGKSKINLKQECDINNLMIGNSAQINFGFPKTVDQ